MVQVPLTQNKFAIVDDEDAERVLQRKWHYHRKKCGGEYAKHSYRKNGKIIDVLMHRFILDAPPGVEIDHKNNNGLDNRRENLRLATSAENKRNRGIQRHNKSGYKGVQLEYGRWSAIIWVDGVRIRIGTFDTKEEAARAYDKGARLWHGEFAKLNFPD